MDTMSEKTAGPFQTDHHRQEKTLAAILAGVADINKNLAALLVAINELVKAMSPKK